MNKSEEDFVSCEEDEGDIPEEISSRNQIMDIVSPMIKHSMLNVHHSQRRYLFEEQKTDDLEHHENEMAKSQRIRPPSHSISLQKSINK
jgi:hypothetical protein